LDYLPVPTVGLSFRPQSCIIFSSPKLDHLPSQSWITFPSQSWFIFPSQSWIIFPAQSWLICPSHKKVGLSSRPEVELSSTRSPKTLKPWVDPGVAPCPGSAPAWPHAPCPGRPRRGPVPHDPALYSRHYWYIPGYNRTIERCVNTTLVNLHCNLKPI